MSDKALTQHNYFRQSRTRFCELVDTGQWSWESLRERPSVVPNALLALNNLGCRATHMVNSFYVSPKLQPEHPRMFG